jgi:hypothetical protein
MSEHETKRAVGALPWENQSFGPGFEGVPAHTIGLSARFLADHRQGRKFSDHTISWPDGRQTIGYELPSPHAAGYRMSEPSAFNRLTTHAAECAHQVRALVHVPLLYQHFEVLVLLRMDHDQTAFRKIVGLTGLNEGFYDSMPGVILSLCHDMLHWGWPRLARHTWMAQRWCQPGAEKAAGLETEPPV